MQTSTYLSHVIYFRSSYFPEQTYCPGLRCRIICFPNVYIKGEKTVLHSRWLKWLRYSNDWGISVCRFDINTFFLLFILISVGINKESTGLVSHKGGCTIFWDKCKRSNKCRAGLSNSCQECTLSRNRGGIVQRVSWSD